VGRIAAVLVALASAGCSYLGTAESFNPVDLDRESGWITVKQVPLVLQEAEEDCGAAALTMALRHWQVPTSLEEVVRACPPEPDRGIKAGVLRDYAHRKGLQAFIFQGRLTDFEKELSQGRPVIVGLVKPYVNGGITHFEVVVGIHPEKEMVVTLDPARGWAKNGYSGFLTEWEPANRLTLAILRPRASPSASQ
jgi:ABC-type bacteriocin/lantibiotic exporter with double-glycine peptidase domain